MRSPFEKRGDVSAGCGEAELINYNALLVRECFDALW